MKHRYIPVIAAFTILVLSCSNKETGNLTTIDLKEALKHTGVVKLSELASDVEFVEFDSTNPEAYFQQVRSLSVGKNHIMVVDEFRNQVILFSRSGKFIRLIGRVGKGPGEYLQCWLSAMDPEESCILVADHLQKQLIKYAITGEFLKSVSYKDLIPVFLLDGLEFIDDEHFGLVARRTGKPSDDFSSVPVFDLDLNLTHKFLNRANDENLKINNNTNQSLFRLKDKLLYHESFFDTLYYLYPDGHEKPAYRIDVGKGGLTREYLSDYNVYINTNPQVFDRVLNVVEVGDYIFMRGFAGEQFELAYRKKTGESFSLTAPDNCYKSEIQIPCVENDLFGYGIFQIRKFNPDLGIYAEILWTPDLQDTAVLNCIRGKQVLLPEKREEFIHIIERTGGGTEILVLLKTLK
jgi:hypothetical protein